MRALGWLLVEVACAHSLLGGTKGQLNFRQRRDEMDGAGGRGRGAQPGRNHEKPSSLARSGTPPRRAKDGDKTPLTKTSTSSISISLIQHRRSLTVESGLQSLFPWG